MRSVLMVAFHYPPCIGSSGVLRTLKFSRYLPEWGWRPLVLSAHPRAFERSGPDQMAEIPQEAHVVRAPAFDSFRHFAVRGRSLRMTALPDQWVSWWAGAVLAGLRLNRRHRPGALWSTYPVATAHLIGLTLQRLTGLPWIADFRDSMTEDHYPRERSTRRSYLAIERRVAERAAYLVFTARSTRQMYLDRYPHLAPDRCLVIPNGYDEADFAGLPEAPMTSSPPRRLRLLHAGLVYPEERDPRPLFRALARLKRAGEIDRDRFSLELRAAGSETEYARLLREGEVDDLVHLLPPLPYRQSLQECLEVDALVLLQGPTCNHQIPAKLYEYLRLRKPILALTDSRGDTAAVLGGTGGATIIDLMDEEAIVRLLPPFLRALRSRTHPVASAEASSQYARHAQARMLAECFEAVAPRPGRADRIATGVKA